MARPDPGLPPQADPQLELSHGGRASIWQITFTVVACVTVIAVTVIGLNSQHEPVPRQQTAQVETAPAPDATQAQPPETTGSAIPATDDPQAPQTGANVPGAENRAPGEGPVNIPAREPEPMRASPPRGQTAPVPTPD